MSPQTPPTGANLPLTRYARSPLQAPTPSRTTSSMRRLLMPLALLALFVPASASSGDASHVGWPEISGMLLMNSRDQSRPLDARPGQDLFDGTDPGYSC